MISGLIEKVFAVLGILSGPPGGDLSKQDDPLPWGRSSTRRGPELPKLKPRPVRLDSGDRDTSEAVAMRAPSLEQSTAVGRLNEALQMRASAKKPVDIEAAKKAIYLACQICYSKGVSRTKVREIIKAISAEFHSNTPSA
jgi:hypothetical protein